MAPIVNLTRITVVGTFVDLEGDPISGRITFSPSFDALLDPDENVIIDNIPLSTDLDEDGSFSLVLPCTDDPDATPQGWTYRVSEPTGRSYDISLPTDIPGGVLDLVDAVPTGQANPGVAILARRIRDSQDYAEPDGNPQDAQVITWSSALGKYRPSPPAVYTAENARDDVGAALREGSTAIDITLDDAANTITITPITGSTSGTLAAGNDSRITGAAQKSENLGDLLDASAARTNLGLAEAAVRAVGTSSGTVAAGDDSRITGAMQKSASLTDLADASTARTALGLGTAATKGVGTSSSDVAAGNDSRITGAAQKSSNLSDLADVVAARATLNAAMALTPTSTKTANYTATAGELVKADASGGSFTITIPAGTVAAIIAVRKTDTSANTVTVTDGGSTNITLSLRDECRILIGQSGSWFSFAGLLTTSGLDTRYMRGSQNLSEVANVATARANLGAQARIPLVVAMTDGATITPNCDTTDVGTVTLGGSRTMAAPSGTPSNGQKLVLRLRQDATGSRLITWNSAYRFAGGAPPTLTTTAAKTDYVGFVYNGTDSKWDCLAVKLGL